jgi:uncharacterized protein YprB with RNaseH-like and TPR domain
MIIKHRLINATLSYPLTQNSILEKSPNIEVSSSKEESSNTEDVSTLEKPSTLDDSYTLDEIAFFDIETTGFSADSSYLYLIGCMYHTNNSWYLTQWLAEDIIDEKEIILSFTKTLSTIKKIIHFNGSTFDIPYLNRKCKALGLINPFLGKKNYDIYKEIFPIKKLLPIPNFKLKTLESFVGINREDTHSGGDLIQVYTSFIGKLQYEKLKALNTSLHSNVDKEDIPLNETNSPSKELEKILLLHNEEDITSLIPISTLLYIKDLFTKPFNNNFRMNHSSRSIHSIPTFCISLNLPYELPFRIKWTCSLGSLLHGGDNDNNVFSSSFLTIAIMNSQMEILIPMFTGSLKYFFKDYKDYYYLPVEDTAIHKSVAEFVDKEYRIKATKANCYTKKSGTYLPSVLPSYSKNNHKDKNNYPTNAFFLNYEDKLYFIEYEEGMFTDIDILEVYIKNLLSLFMNNKEITLTIE